MLSEENIKEQQENELSALQAIFMEDLKDLRGDEVWNKWIPLNISITLTPPRGSSGSHEVHAKLDLHIICSQNYPNKVPIIQLEQPSGLSNKDLNKLKGELESKAQKLVGEVMIFELCEWVKKFLDEHNKPGTKSFHEQMLRREEQQQQEEQEAKQINQVREKQKLLNEVNERVKTLEMEKNRRKEARLSSENSTESDIPISRFHPSFSDESETLRCEHLNTTLIEFSTGQKILRGSCIAHSEHKCVLYSGLDQTNGQLYLISEWKLNMDSEKQISSLIQEMNYMVKLKHSNLAHYLNICCENLSEENKTVLYVLQEFVLGLNCTQIYLSQNIATEIDVIRYIAEGVLNALDFLHRNNVVHKDLTDSCVYIDKNGTVKVSNYNLHKRISDLVSEAQSSNYKKKIDIYKFGILILSLVKGCFIEEDNITIPKNIPSNLQDFLSHCFSSNERYTASELRNHSFLKVPLMRYSPLRNGEIKEPQRIESPEEKADLSMIAYKAYGGQSRVKKEFKILDHLGKGAYGDVYKVQNILDQRYYALKCIELDPKNKKINRKIIKEVKLLSRLNHENIVRYYNSWIEAAIVDNNIEDDSTDSSLATFRITKSSNKDVNINDDSEIEKLAPPIRDTEWSFKSIDVNYVNKSKLITNESSSDDCSDDSADDDDDDNWDIQESNDIEFEYDGVTIPEIENEYDDTDSSVPQRTKEVQFMYIQMEFCEKSTLKTAIDGGLYKDENRVWRLFREIVEGLAHIHQQDMIHRDLKPMNIFLDSNDHVKIGDFGLATTNLPQKLNNPITMSKSYYDNNGSQEIVGDLSMTGDVGTALYLAPELKATAKTKYNEKVDIYSLGIIFFEMSYPLKTTMERISVINKLRSEKIVLPPDFLETAKSNQEKIIRWLLNQNASERPTSQKLLDSIPPPVLEERQLRDLVGHTLNNPQLKAYKYLVESCFKQVVTDAQDITYDRDLSTANAIKNIQLYNHIKENTIKVFKLHGGQNLSTPLLMPKSKYYDSNDTSVNLMTHSGIVVSLPHDLRVPFARYVAWNGITCMRRYSIERVYREKRVFGFIPRELYECAFDIVTPTPDFMADAELLYILSEVIEEVPSLKNRKLLIRLNHTLLLKAILIHCGIKDKENELYTLLSEEREGKVTKLQVHTYLINRGLSDNSITTLYNLLKLEGNIHKITSSIANITKKKNSVAAEYAKKGLEELKSITQNAEAFEIPYDIVIKLGIVYNVQQYSGMMCQLVCEVRRKQKCSMDVLAAGGRYDNMISKYRNMMVEANILNKDIKQSASGISISLDKLISATQKDQNNENKLSDLDAVVCSMGNNTLFKEKSKVLKDLWSAGLKCYLIEAATLEDVQEQLNVPCVVILKDTEVKIRCWDCERDRYQEKKIGINEVVETIQRIIKSGSETCSDQSSFSNPLLMRTESKMSHISVENQDASVNIYFLSTEIKISPNYKKRLENQIRSQMNSVFERLNGEVSLLVISLDNSVVTTIASFLEFEPEDKFQKSVELVKEKHPRHKKYLIQICDKIFEEMNKLRKPVIIIYSQIDNFYKVLL